MTEETVADKVAADKAAADKVVAERKLAAAKIGLEAAKIGLEAISTSFSKIYTWLTPLLLVIAVGYFLYTGLTSNLIGKLGDPAFARGLITFIITVSTIGLAFLMVIKAFSSDDTNNAEEADNKYRRAREIFAGLMGILGTIVGFYFGSAEKASPLLNVADIQTIGKTVVSNVTGGTEPYRYTITPSSDAKDEKGGNLNPVLDQISSDGWIKYSFLEKPISGTLTIVVTDSKNASASKTKELKATAAVPKGEINVNPSIAPNGKKQ